MINIKFYFFTENNFDIKKSILHERIKHNFMGKEK